MVQDRELAVGTRRGVLPTDTAVEHEKAEGDVAEQRAALRDLEGSFPPVGLQLATVMQQRAGKDELWVGAAPLADGAPDGRDFAGVLEQAAEIRVVARGGRRAPKI